MLVSFAEIPEGRKFIVTPNAPGHLGQHVFVKTREDRAVVIGGTYGTAVSQGPEFRNFLPKDAVQPV